MKLLRALVCLALLNLALTASVAQAAPVLAKGKAVMADAGTGLHAGLARRARARRRVERARMMPAVVPASLRARPQQASFALPARAAEPPVVSSAPPDHPPA